ncbi:MAG: LPS translocon maturation chaperone LptM [Arenicella sp.]
MKTAKTATLILLSALFIAACGNKGDLFLPEQPNQDAKQAEVDDKSIKKQL